MANLVSKAVAFLRAGYPAGMPATGYLPAFALLPRRPSDEEVAAIARSVTDRGGAIDAADVGVEITRVTDEMPSPDAIERVRERLAASGRSARHRP